MDIPAKVTSKGQITVPKSVRDALGIRAGDSVVFRVQGACATLAKTRDLLDLAGTVHVPPAKSGATWEEVLHGTRAARTR